MTIHSQLLDALAADEKFGGKHLPCGVLRLLLLDEKSISQFQPNLVDQALFLIAVYRKFLKALEKDLIDLDLPFSAKQKSWGKTRKSGWHPVPANQIKLKTIPIRSVSLFLNTNNFLRSLPLDFVRELIKWAPPVIAQDPKQKQPDLAFENVLSAYIASHLLAGKPIKVKILTQYPTPRFTLHDLLQTLEYLEPLYQEHKQRIVINATSPERAILITELKQAQVYRLRQCANVRE